MAQQTHAERVADHQHRAAELIMELCNEAGVSRSPSAVRHRLAGVLGTACSQATVRRLVDALNDAWLAPPPPTGVRPRSANLHLRDEGGAGL